MEPFSRDSDIFRSEHVLRDSYTPDELMEREEERQDYIQALQPIANASVPQNIFVYGDTGVGKTDATQIVLGELKDATEEYDDVDLETIWVNCRDRSSYDVVTQLVNTFRSSSEEISSTGHSTSRVYEFLWEEIESCEATHVVVVLDEIDSLGEDDSLLYQIPRAESIGNLEETHVGLIGICNDFRYRDGLSPRVTSTLCEFEIRFGPYDADELGAILEQRADEAFYPGAIDDGVIELAGALAGQDTGSARHAIDILHKAGTLARRQGASEVTDDHVREAQRLVEESVIEQELRDLPTQSHIVLYAVTALEKADRAPARRQEIYGIYEKVCGQVDATVKSERTVLNRLNKLAMKSFIETTDDNQGKAGGRRYEYSLNIDIDLVVNALRADDRLRDATAGPSLAEE
ncbi:Cdc6/Cdc18 family protein [Halobaculum sp. MBLA0147]|uniref:Cdc6/Cdc18 family protein n=1 Tax=Halobaculum sp. MBLA0147 TaxID=3079934 RepID=UPI0035234EEF